MYCKHGTNIGTPGGPDLMCGFCESGEEPYIPTAEDRWRDFCADWRVINTLNRIMAGEARYPSDPEAWSNVLGVEEAVLQMETAVRQAILPDVKRHLAAYLRITRYCRSEQFPGDPESPECELERRDAHESGVHMRFDATGGVSAEWEV